MTEQNERYTFVASDGGKWTYDPTEDQEFPWWNWGLTCRERAFCITSADDYRKAAYIMDRWHADHSEGSYDEEVPND